MRIKAIAIRILRQFVHDKRTIAMMMLAPLLLLTLVYFIFDASPDDLKVGVVNSPQSYTDKLEEQNFRVTHYGSVDEAMKAAENREVIAAVDIISGNMDIYIDGSSSSKSASVLAGIKNAASTQVSNHNMEPDITYIYGKDDMTMFDNFGSTLIGFIVFFFVFLISGIAFLQERTSGTLERLLSTPVRRYEIMSGYVLGYGIMTIIQSLLISLFVIYVLDVIMIGSIFAIMIITILCAICALTLGTLISTAAQNEFQMIQFVPIIIIPQLFFSGLFDLSPGWLIFGKFLPIYYASEALNEVMIRGGGFADIRIEMLALLGFTLLFMLINIRLLKKYRRL